MINYFLNHWHSDRSNFRLKDSINKIDKCIDYAIELDISGMALTDHETLGGHVEAIQYVKKGKEKGNIPENFRLGLGNEIYLVDRDEALNAKANNLPMKFYHFILIAKNPRGYEALKKLSSKAWDNSYWFRGMERVPTYKDDLEQIMEEYKGDIIATSACVGSELAQTILNWSRETDVNKKKEQKFKIHHLMTWYQKLFGEDFYVEIQPSHQIDQVEFNNHAISIAKAYNVKLTVATDAHYLNKEKARSHEIYLKADEGEREVAEFYSTTYIMSSDEIIEYMKPYIAEEILLEAFSNTLEIQSKIEEFDLKLDTLVPDVKIPEFELKHLFNDYYDKYPYIKMYAESSYEEDRYHLYQIENGFIKYKQELNDENLYRLNKEYEELWKVSENLQQRVSSYYLLTQRVVDIMWEVSLVGPSRGSAAAWYTVYLLGITQVNPIKFDLPHWRHLSAERPEMPSSKIGHQM